MGRRGRPHRLVAAVTALVTLAWGCQTLLDFTPREDTKQSVPDSGGDSLASGDARVIDGAVGPFCPQSDAAFCVDFSTPSDVTTAIWSYVAPSGITLSPKGATSPPTAAGLSTPVGTGNQTATLLTRRFNFQGSRMRVVAQVSSDREVHQMAVVVSNGTGSISLICGVMDDQLQMLVQGAASDNVPPASAGPGLVGKVHPLEFELERGDASTYKATIRLVDLPGVSVQYPLPAGFDITQAELNVGVWYRESTTVTVDDVAVWID